MTMGKKVAGWLGSVLLVLVLYLFLWPVPIHPIAWEPHPAPALDGAFAENRVLQGMELFATPNTHGPEDVAVAQVFADTGGRPAGLDFDNDGNLIVADTAKGLLSIDPNGAIEVLCTEAGYHPFGLTDDVDVDSQNVAWFSDASHKWTFQEYMNDVLESAPHGRLLKYDINTGECSVVLDELFFANGIAVSPDDTYVLVNETTRYRVKRVYVRGPRMGDVEVFIDNLPGLPDGISTGADGIFWLALFAPRNETLDFAGPKPWVRKLIYRTPAALQPKPRRHPLILGLDASGNVVHNLQDADGANFSMSTSVEQVGDWLYVGSIAEAKWGRIRVSSLP
jgi:sugar lactone lactonase YvrE